MTTELTTELATDPHQTDQSFYEQLTMRNRGFIPEAAQQRLRGATILVAGCGSTGGAAVEPLVRLGAEHLLLAEPGEYELNNLNRQNAFVEEIGENKAVVCARRVHGINPGARTEVFDRGITSANVRELVWRATVVIDGVDVTERSGWDAKYRLHEAAAALGVPVVTGWDMAGTQYVRFYGYRPGDRPFDGRIARIDVEEATTWDLMKRSIPMRFVPIEMLEQARRQVAAQRLAAHSRGPRSEDEGMPQLVHASLLFGAVAARIILNLMQDRPVRCHTVVNVDREVGTSVRNALGRIRKPVVAGLALRDLALLRREEKLHD